jgi:hypothetical protein
MNRVSLTDKAHAAIATVLTSGDIAIDATVGNGRDTEFLALAVGESGMVYGFDIQPQALASARERLAKAGLMRRVTLVEAGHEEMRGKLPMDVSGRVNAVMFNLGYLPGGSHSLTTMTATTLAALNAALEIIAPQGIVTVMCYPGHPEGAKECAGVENWASSLDGNAYRTSWTEANANTLTPPPRLLVVVRR